MTALALVIPLLLIPAAKGKARLALSEREQSRTAPSESISPQGLSAERASAGRSRSESARPIRFLARHTNAVLSHKCLPTHKSLPRTRSQARLWHLQAHRAKRGTCKPATPWPAWWYGQAMCIHRREGAWSSDTGNGYGGGYQFLVGTFNRAAGSGVPAVSSTGQIARLSPWIQTLAAYRIWKQDGGSWREWGTAGMCGLS